MNKDRVEGKIKDVAGRTERQAGEWTGDKEKQVRGTVKQVEGSAKEELASRMLTNQSGRKKRRSVPVAAKRASLGQGWGRPRESVESFAVPANLRFHPLQS